MHLSHGSPFCPERRRANPAKGEVMPTDERFGTVRQLTASLRSAWREIDGVIATLDARLEEARVAAVLAAKQVARNTLDEACRQAPVAVLDQYGLWREASARLGRTPLRTVSTVVTLGRDGLMRLPGIGPGTADPVMRAAARMQAAVIGSVRLPPDPDNTRPHDGALLRAVYRYDDLRRALRPARAEARTWRDGQDRAVAAVLEDAGTVGLLFSKKRRREVAERAEPLRDAVIEKRAALHAVLDAASTNDPTTEQRWAQYRANAASFVAALESLQITFQPVTDGVDIDRTALDPWPPPGWTSGADSVLIEDGPRDDRWPEQGPSAGDRGTGSWSDNPRTDTRRHDAGRPSPVLRRATPQAQVPAPYVPDQRGGLPAEIADQVERLSLEPGPLVATLRRYQEFGARYLVHQRRTLLGDEMGLGKTVQVLAAMCHLHAGGDRHFFVVAPNSVLINWEREVDKHTVMRAYLAHGPHRLSALAAWKHHGGVAITTYGTVSKLLPHLDRVDLLALDEAHFVKNPEAQRTRAVKRLVERAGYVAMLSGTALENRLEELHSLVVMAQPGMGRQLATLLEQHRPDPVRTRRELAPVYLRRTQADVLTELPERVELDEWVALEAEHLDAYRLADGHIMTKRAAATLGAGAHSAPKFERLRELLDTYREEGRKVVVFSYFREVLDAVCLQANGCPQINGQVSPTVRQQMIDEFSERNGHAVLASQIDAGGLGINLQAAQVVIIMEPQLKPSSEQQAIARVYRMGQTRRVTVHRLLAKDTVDEALVRLLARKQEIFDTYADPSSVKEASDMATDGSTRDLESELRAYLADERTGGIRDR